MLKKNTTSQSSRSTRRSGAPTVLKPIYPAVPKKISNTVNVNVMNTRTSTMSNTTHPSSTANTSAFLLPSSEFFVVDKDSLILSESDIFQTTNSSKRTRHDEDSDSEDESEVDENVKINFNNNNDNNNDNRKVKPVALKTQSQQQNYNTHVPQPTSALDKGLRHFSAKVCAKVEEKGVTTYNEVADDLVQEIGLELGKCDHKNIRRRVYDALNVLMAIDIIRKEKKEIRWLGLPNEAADDLRQLETERSLLQERITEKSRNLKEVLRRCISLKNLIDRNSELQNTQQGQGDKLPLPFILISAARDCHVHCEMLEDRTQYFFEFNTAFQINEDIELMRLMGLDTGRIERIKSFFPKELVAQVLMLCLNNNNSNNNASVDITTSAATSSLHNSIAVNNSVFAPIINNEDLNLGDLESFSSSSILSSSL